MLRGFHDAADRLELRDRDRDLLTSFKAVYETQFAVALDACGGLV